MKDEDYYFMKYFLKETARDISNRHGGNLPELCIVFPNRRSGLFFRHYLSDFLDKPVFSPKITTISELMESLSGYQMADNLSLIFQLYQIYKQEKKVEEPFDEFYFWGDMLLNDFNEIDKYLVEAEELFQNLATLKSIEDKFSYLTEEQLEAIRQFWDTIDMHRLSDQQEYFIRIWKILYKVYRRLNKQLEDKNLAYEGKIYRSVAEKINSGNLETPHSTYIFVGFNALTNAEKKLFKHLNNSRIAEFYWDYDNYYLQEHEAGKFIRQNLREFSENKIDINNSFKEKKNIRFINTTYDIAQAKILPELFSDMPASAKEPNHTSVILPDENLLLPVLNSLPSDFPAVNVTMGYPIDITPAFSLLQTLIQLQKNARKKDGKQLFFYYKDVLSILNHQYMGVFQDESTEEKIKEIKEKNKIYIDAEELKLNPVTRSLFTGPDNFKSVTDYLLENYFTFYRHLKEKSREEEQSAILELECIYNVFISIKRLKEIFDQQETELNPDTYLRILERIIQNQTISYQGEPLSGLQIMGVLETRALDFEHIVILSMNEGSFPKSDVASSFIPHSLKKGFGLPTFEHNDAIYTYYFYRMIQRAQNVTLVYNSASDGTQTGEMSRLMHQLKYESGFSVSEETVYSDINIPEIKEITIDKTPEILDELEQYNSLNERYSTLSPSSLKTYLRCSLQFYFKKIAGLPEPEEVAEDIDLPMFGTLLHTSLELLYQDFLEKGHEVTKADLEKIEKNNPYIEKLILQSFSKEYFKDEQNKAVELTGKNILIKEIIQQYVKQFIRAEKKFAPFRIKDLEKKYFGNISFQTSGGQKKVTFGGNIDRVDENHDGIRIIDYKTGGADLGFNNTDTLFERRGNHDALQSLIYALMYKQTHGDNKVINPGLYAVRDLFRPNFDYKLKMNKDTILFDNVEKEVQEGLRRILTEIFNPEIPFSQTEDEDICKNCPYKKICRRE